MKRIFLIRHGLPEFPEGQRQCVGSTDIPLSTAGSAQAAEMARTLPASIGGIFQSSDPGFGDGTSHLLRVYRSGRPAGAGCRAAALFWGMRGCPASRSTRHEGHSCLLCASALFAPSVRKHTEATAAPTAMAATICTASSP